MAHQCSHCQAPLPRKKNPGQHFCGKPECQRARKRLWQKHKMQTDPDYRDNQKRANREWLKNNPDYWKRYRESRPEYAERNRSQSRQRMQIRRQVDTLLGMFAKMDATLVDSTRLSGCYGLIPLGPMFAKMDAKFLNVNISQQDTG